MRPSWIIIQEALKFPIYSNSPLFQAVTTTDFLLDKLPPNENIRNALHAFSGEKHPILAVESLLQ